MLFPDKEHLKSVDLFYISSCTLIFTYILLLHGDSVAELIKYMYKCIFLYNLIEFAVIYCNFNYATYYISSLILIVVVCTRLLYMCDCCGDPILYLFNLDYGFCHAGGIFVILYTYTYIVKMLSYVYIYIHTYTYSCMLLTLKS